MKVQFNSPREIDGTHYPVGIHEVSDKLESHWYFLALLTNKVVTKVAASAKVSDVKPKRQPKAVDKKGNPIMPNVRVEDQAALAAAQTKGDGGGEDSKETKPEAPAKTAEELEADKKAKQAASLEKRKATLEAKKAAAKG